VGSGIGKTQQRILDAPADDSIHRTLALDSDGELCAGEPERDGMTVTTLAELVGVSVRQIRTAVRALERRGLVSISKECVGRSGRGEYGPMVNTRWARNADLPVARTEIKRIEEHDPQRWMTLKRYRVEFGHAGMPRAGLLVRLRDATDPMITGTPRRRSAGRTV
jgi:DNA-binding transcriptional ArsR family regulator